MRDVTVGGCVHKVASQVMMRVCSVWLQVLQLRFSWTSFMLNSWNGKESQKKHCNQSNEKLITFAPRNEKIRRANEKNLPRSHHSINPQPPLSNSGWRIKIELFISSESKKAYPGGWKPMHLRLAGPFERTRQTRQLAEKIRICFNGEGLMRKSTVAFGVY